MRLWKNAETWLTWLKISEMILISKWVIKLKSNWLIKLRILKNFQNSKRKLKQLTMTFQDQMMKSLLQQTLSRDLERDNQKKMFSIQKQTQSKSLFRIHYPRFQKKYSLLSWQSERQHWQSFWLTCNSNNPPKRILRLRPFLILIQNLL